MEYILRVQTTGSNGSATGTKRTSQAVKGYIRGALVHYHASAPVTTVVKLKEVGGMARELVDLAAGNTDKTVFPVVQQTDDAGTDVADQFASPYVFGRFLVVEVTASNALTEAVVVTVQVDEHAN